MQATHRGLAQFLLFGNRDEIDYLLNQKNAEKEHVHIFHARTKEQAAELAVRAVHQNEATVLMKGNISSSTL